jgi:hypothetical protein
MTEMSRPREQPVDAKLGKRPTPERLRHDAADADRRQQFERFLPPNYGAVTRRDQGGEPGVNVHRGHNTEDGKPSR